MNASSHKGSEKGATDAKSASGRSKGWLFLLLIPIIGLLYPPFYSHINPEIGGIPFFIWYQFAWVFGGVATTLTVNKIHG